MLWGGLRFSIFAAVLTGLVLVLLFGQESAFAVSGGAHAAPAAPSNITVKPYGPLDFYVTWKSHSTNQTGFEITNGVTTTTVGPAKTSYLWPVPAAQTYMCFAVRAVNADGASGWAGQWTCATTPAGGQPAPPTNVTVKAVSASEIQISLVNHANNETAFLFSNGVSIKAQISYNEPGPGGKVSYLWKGLKPGTYMCFKAAAYNQWGRSSYAPASWACASTPGTPGTWANGQKITGAKGFNADGVAQLTSVSCPSAGNCAAGGYYRDGSDNTQAFVVDEVKGVWGSAKEVTGASKFNVGGNAEVLTISCASAGNCAAGGYYTDGNNSHNQAFVVDETSGAWGKAIEVPNLANLNQGFTAEVLSVSCRSAGNCSASGYYTDGTGAANTWAFVASEVNGQWQPGEQVPGLSDVMPGGSSQATSVSCWSPGNCTAVGYYTDSSQVNHQAFAVTEASGSWDVLATITGPASFNTGGDASLQSVACPSAGNCSAGGFDWDNSNNQNAFVVSETNGNWGNPTDAGTTSLNVTGTAQINSVSCAAAGYCSAGGYYSDADFHHEPFLVDEVRGAWGKPQSIGGLPDFDGGGGRYGEIASVSCAAAGSCSAGGFYLNGSNNNVAFTTGETGDVWSDAKRVPGVTKLGYSSGINRVSCASVRSCAAVGYFLDDASASQPLVVSKS